MRVIFGLIFSILVYVSSFAQIINSSFIVPDTVCVNQTFTIQNTSTGSINSTYWNFCTSSVVLTQSVNLGTSASSFPVFMSINNDAGSYYAFVSHNFPGGMSRFDFGTSLNNIPTSINLGNFGGQMPGNSEGIVIEQEGTNWYGVVVGGPIGTIARMDFGTTLANTPTVVSMGNIGTLSYPHRLKVIHAGGNKYGFTVNRNSNTITRFDFGNSLSNIPTGTNLGNIGNMSGPNDFDIVYVNGNWHMFVTNDGNNTLVRLDFGNSLLNTPTGTNLGNIGVGNLRGISIDVNCGGIGGQVTSQGNSYYNLDFPTGPTGPANTTFVGNTGFSFPHSIEKFRVSDTVYTFVPNANGNSLARLKYSSCSISAIANSTLVNLAPLSFSTAGVYTISILNNSNQYNQSVYCKVIVVGTTAINAIASPSNVCSGSSATLIGSGASNYTWSPGSVTGNSIVITPTSSTIYTVSGTNFGGCNSTKTIAIILVQTPTVNANASSFTICSGKSTILSATGAFVYTWSPGALTGSNVIVSPNTTIIYTVVGSINNCNDTKTIQINVNTTPTVNINSIPGLICLGDQGSLEGSGATTYTWLPTSSNNTNIIITPTTTTTYTLYGQTGACIGSSITTVTVNPYPSLAAFVTTPTLCLGKSTDVLASGASTYTWQPGGLFGFSVNVSPTVSTIYTVTGSQFNCASTTTINVTVVQNPTINIYMSPTVTCIEATQGVTLTAGGANTYTWLPVALSTQSIAVSPSVSLVYSVSGTNLFGCISQNTTVLNISPDLRSGSSATTICLGSTVNLTASGATSYTWMPGNFVQANVNLVPDANTSFTVIGSNGICSMVKTVYIEVTTNPINEIPEVFTPNDDGKNDRFVIKTEAQAKIDIKVFNRWGSLVYKNTEYDNTWDGTANSGTLFGNSKLPQGTYYYIIDIESCDKQLVRGYVVIQY